MKKIAAVSLLLLLAGCSAPAAARTTPAPPVPVKTTAAAPTTSAAPDWEAGLAKFETDNAIKSSDWYAQVTGREVKYGNSLWVYTKMGTNSAAKSMAASVCGAYAQYALDNAAVGTVFVRSADGSQLAKCGPKA